MSQLQYQRQTSNVINGTSLQGYTCATYSQLVSAFGKPELSSAEDGKVNHLWVVNIEGVIATIYDYKEDLNTGKTEDWHVGGFVAGASDLVNQILEEAK